MQEIECLAIEVWAHKTWQLKSLMLQCYDPASRDEGIIINISLSRVYRLSEILIFAFGYSMFVWTYTSFIEGMPKHSFLIGHHHHYLMRGKTMFMEWRNPLRRKNRLFRVEYLWIPVKLEIISPDSIGSIRIHELGGMKHAWPQFEDRYREETSGSILIGLTILRGIYLEKAKGTIRFDTSSH